MAVPNTDSFNLQNVTVEIYGDVSAGRNLISCFADANASGFDALYSGSKNSLLNFRNYSHINSTSFLMAGGLPWASIPSACGSNPFFGTRYHNGAGTYPVVNDYVYTDSGLTTPFVGYNPATESQKFWKVSPFYYVSVTNVGLVTAAGFC